MTTTEPVRNTIDKPTPKGVYSSLRMARVSDAHTPFLICEGITDQKVLRALIASLRTDLRPRLFPGYGKINALRVEKLCRSLGGVSPVAFVVDADYDRHVGQSHQSPTVFYTDANDMECTMLMVDDILERWRDRENLVPSAVLNKVLSETGCGTWHEFIVDRASRMGQYRLVDRQQKLGLSFRSREAGGPTDPPWGEFLEPPTFTWNDARFRDWLLVQNTEPEDRREVVDRLFSVFECIRDAPRGLDLCRGHDLLQVLSVVVNYLAPKGWPQYEPTQLEEMLRMVVDLNKLGGTAMWKSVNRFAEVEVTCPHE